MYGAFIDSRTRAIPANDHVCTACPAVAHLDLKVVLHRGHSVRQRVGSGSDLLGPAVTVAHRLLKNTVRERIGFRPYLFLTDAAATGLGLSEVGFAHHEEYPDAGRIEGRVVELGETGAGGRFRLEARHPRGYHGAVRPSPGADERLLELILDGAASIAAHDGDRSLGVEPGLLQQASGERAGPADAAVARDADSCPARRRRSTSRSSAAKAARSPGAGTTCPEFGGCESGRGAGDGSFGVRWSTMGQRMTGIPWLPRIGLNAGTPQAMSS